MFQHCLEELCLYNSVSQSPVCGNRRYGIGEGINLGKKGEVQRYFDGQQALAVHILSSKNEANTRARNDIYYYEGLSQLMCL